MVQSEIQTHHFSASVCTHCASSEKGKLDVEVLFEHITILGARDVRILRGRLSQFHKCELYTGILFFELEMHIGLLV